MAWVSLMYVENTMTSQAPFNILKSVFNNDDGEDQLGHRLGGRFKAAVLFLGRFNSHFTFSEPRVDALLNGLARLFSWRYGPDSGDPLTEERDKQIQDLETLDAFDHTFQTLLGEESGWKIPMGPKAQRVDSGLNVTRVQETTTRRNFRMRGFWPDRAPITRTQTAGIAPASHFYPSLMLA